MKKAETTAIIPKEVVKQDVSIEAILTQAIDKGVPVETMERLMVMRRELKAERAKELFNRSMAAFQAECPEIAKTKPVYTKNGQLAYKYAPIEAIVDQVKSLLTKHGFSYSTTMELKENGVRVICKVTHEAGHSEESPMEVPFGTQTQMMSNSQVTAAASTFAKRYAFCNAFGILTGDEDTDAKKVDEGEGIVIRMDEEPFPSSSRKAPEKLPKGPKQAIAELLLKLGYDVLVLKGPASNAKIEELTGLKMETANYTEIENRLGVLISEKKV